MAVFPYFSFRCLGLLGMLLTAAAGIYPAAASEPIRIAVKAEAEVEGETILLGQIAHVLGEHSHLLDALRLVEVGRSPLPGQSLLIHPGQIGMRLKQNDIEPDGYRIEARGPVKVVRRHASVSSDQVRAAVQEFITAHAPWTSDQMKIRPIRYQQDHILPTGRLTFQVAPPKHTDWLGAVPFSVRLLVDGQTVKKTSVPVYIEVWGDVVQAVKPLGRNQPITAADLKMEKANLARVPVNAIVRMDQVIGQRANRSIAVNSILRSDQVDAPPAVRKGDVVQVLTETGRLRVTTQAIAQENGGVGENVQVMNLTSKKLIHAKVVDAQTVRVDF